ncbi:MAG: redoxin domain-containing protein [Puniceicoccales bacterium]|jgi:peroxiredoxin|nr:redoxin domain-containing protein [Puniceicoccales bacterium]
MLAAPEPGGKVGVEKHITTMALPIGSKAPAITLKSKDASGLADVSLTRSIGKKQTVLLFVPLAFTGVCTEELCSISNSIQAYNSLNADVIAVSVDSPFAQEVWAKNSGLQFTLASDFNREAATAYGVREDNFLPGVLGYKGIAKRSAFVFGIDGIIKFSWSSDDSSKLPPFDAINKALKS